MPHRDPSASELIEQVVRSILQREARLEQLKAEAEATEAELGELRIANKVLQGMLGTVAVSASVNESDDEEDNEGGPNTGPALAEPSRPTQERKPQTLMPLRGSKVPIVEASKDEIRKAGEPLHQAVIASRLLAGGYPYKGPADRLPDTIGKVLARDAKDEKEVVKTAPGTFGLLEWRRDVPEATEEGLFAPDAEPEERVA